MSQTQHVNKSTKDVLNFDKSEIKGDIIDVNSTTLSISRLFHIIGWLGLQTLTKQPEPQSLWKRAGA